VHLHIHVLDLGELPIYELEAEHYYQWGRASNFANGGVWNIRPLTVNHRAIISLELDEPLTDLVAQLSDRLRAFSQPLDGTLILTIRAVYELDHGIWIDGGLAFVERAYMGIDLEGQDPSYLIEQLCLLLAGKDYDRSTFGLEAWRIRLEDEKRERKAKRDSVEAKARAILMAHLDETQVSEFESSGSFHVLGVDGYTYLITSKEQHNVFRIEGGRRTSEYCIVMKDFVPLQDQMLTQMLLLMTTPTMFHQIANTWEIREDGTRIRIAGRLVDVLENPAAQIG
jgi:hypothetical protein